MGVGANIHINTFDNPLWLEFLYDFCKIAHILYSGKPYKEFTLRQKTCNIGFHRSFCEM